MRISKFFPSIGISAAPLVFAAVALGLAALHVSLERKAGPAGGRTVHPATLQEGGVPDKLVSAKFPELAAAAEKGDLSAEIEIGRRLAQGQGVKKDEGRAALHFQAVIDRLGDIGARDKRGPLAAAAYRFLAQFHLRGVPGTHIAADPAHAFDLLHRAASYFGDPVAQYELAKLHIDGVGVTKNLRVAAQWLLRASQKGYAPAQALLGDMLWHGSGVERVPGQGLGLLAIARRNASAGDKVWVSKMFETARAEALPIEILEANAFIVRESGASPFGIDGGFLSGGSRESTGAAGAGAGAGANTRSGLNGGLIIHNLDIFSAFGAGPMGFEQETPAGFGQEAPAADLPIRKSDTPARSVKLYRLWEREAHASGGGQVRVAGVAN